MPNTHLYLSVYKCHVQRQHTPSVSGVQAAREFDVYFQCPNACSQCGGALSLCPSPSGLQLPSVCFAKGWKLSRQFVCSFLVNTHCACRKIFCTCLDGEPWQRTPPHTHSHIRFYECAILSRLSCHCATVCHKWQSHPFHWADVRSNEMLCALIYRNSLAFCQLALLLIIAIK